MRPTKENETRTSSKLLLQGRVHTLRMAVKKKAGVALSRRSRQLAERSKRYRTRADNLRQGLRGTGKHRASLPREKFRRKKSPYEPWEYVVRGVGSQEGLRLLMGAGLFGRSLPRELTAPEGERLLVLVPHQDDDGIGAAGTLLLAADAGKTTRIVYYTDGATGFGDFEPQEISRIRYEEARRAWRGVPGVSLEFLGIPDGGPSVPPRAVDRLAEIVEQFEPDTIFVPNFLEEPHAHSMLSRWLLMLDKRQPLDPGVDVWGYQVTTRVPGNVVVDITSVSKRKRRLNRAWTTSNASIDYGHLAMGQDIANAYYLKGGAFTKPRRPYAEVFLRFPASDYLRLCREFFALTESFEGSEAAYVPPPDFLVCGLQKSGTYWLTAMLNAHPQIRCFPSLPARGDGSGEAHFFDVLARLDSDYASFSKSMSKKLEGRLAERVPAERPDSGEACAALRQSLRDGFSRYCDEQRRMHGKPFVGEKTAETIHHLDLVEELYPGIKKVCILRDPRDRLVSHHNHQIRKGRREAGPITAEHVEHYLEAYLRRDYAGLAELEQHSFVLTYEQLAADPRPVLSALLGFLGGYSADEYVEQLVEQGSFERLAQREQGDEDRGSYYRKGVVGDWRASLEPELAKRIVAELEEPTRAVEQRHGIDLSGYRAG